MRILFLSSAKSIHSLKWVNALAERGHIIHLVFNKDHSPDGHNYIHPSVMLHCLKYSGLKGYYLNSYQLKKIYNKIQPDIVNAHYASGYGTLARQARIKPLILSVWGSDVYDFPYQSIVKMKIIKKNIFYADKIASTSMCMAEQVRKLVNYKLIEIEITPFGIDLNKFSRRRNRNESGDGKITIGVVKALSPKYGIGDLIKAIRYLKDDLENEGMKNITDNLSVQIYGDGEQKIELVELTRSLNLQKSIEFKGKISHDLVPDALEHFDIFCASSISTESFGVAIVEAMAMELPVVATDVDGFKEVINNDITGLIVQKQQPMKLAEALKKMILNENLRRNMGKLGRERVEKLYNWDDNVKTMEKLYLTFKD